MAESEAVSDLRGALEAHLRQAFGSYEVDRDNDFVVRHGSASVFIRPLELEQSAPADSAPGPLTSRTFVRVWSITNVDVPITGELTRYLASENGGFALGKFSLGDEEGGRVLFAHTLLGDFLNREELELAVVAVAGTADEYDNRIKERFGGRLFTDAPEILAELMAIVEATAGEVEAPSERTVAVQVLFGLLSLVAAIGGGIYAYSVESSIWLSLFVALLALNLVGRGIPDVITDPNKVQRALYFLLLPALATGILAGTYELWGEWWLSALLGLIAGAVLNAVLAPVLFPGIHREETIDTARRIIRQRRAMRGG